jgi:hypothetical protein
MEFSLRKKFFVNYDPFFLVKLQYLPNKTNIFSLNVSYGGYGSADIYETHDFNYGLEYAHDFGNGLIIHAGGNFLNGYIYPYTTRAQGVFISIKKYFF